MGYKPEFIIQPLILTYLSPPKKKSFSVMCF